MMFFVVFDFFTVLPCYRIIYFFARCPSFISTIGGICCCYCEHVLHGINATEQLLLIVTLVAGRTTHESDFESCPFNQRTKCSVMHA
jgi:hypothetical protein